MVTTQCLCVSILVSYHKFLYSMISIFQWETESRKFAKLRDESYRHYTVVGEPNVRLGVRKGADAVESSVNVEWTL